MKLVAVLGAVVTALAVQYFALIRPWYQTWGATAEEMQRTLPGDELWPDARLVETRAVTIAAPPARVWPWVAQLGQHRGGFYSYRFLEDLVGCRMPDADRVLGLPQPVVGERFWLAPPDRYDGQGYATYGLVEPDRAMVLLTHWPSDVLPDGTARVGGTWAFVLEPGPSGTTRLLVRGRSGHERESPGMGEVAFRSLLYDPIHFVMERRMLLGIRDRAEGRPLTPSWVDVGNALLWIVTGLLGLAALIAAVLRRAEAWKPLAAATAALFVLTLLFFARPPLAVGIALVAALRWALSWAWRRPAGPASAAHA